MKRISFVASLLILLTVGLPVLASAGEAEFLRLQAEVEQTILEFRDVVEAAYGNRCDNTNLEQCYQSNYHGCLSSFPSASCPAVNDFVFEVCLGGSDCSSLFDYTVSSIRYPPLTQINSDLDPDLVASTCFSQNLDEYFINQRDTDLEYWEQWGVESPWMHFSSITGQFRIYPARPDDRCFTYDPRVRPFYVAGSSGPKNILLLLDTSGSMDGLRMENMKTAAERVVSTLTIGDRVALVPFSTRAEVVEVGSQKLMKANEDVKEQLIQRIRNLEAVGSTNFYDAFDKAFSIMQEAIPNELVVECNTAVLFLTDGKMTEPEDVTEAQVLQFAQDGLKEMEDNIGHPVRLFTYSISQDNDVHTFPKELACATETPGVWSKIVNAEDIVDSLSSYYKLFALGLGEGNNEDFVAWVEPYEFFNAKIMGTTVSAPAFDRSVDPPVLIGVVGMDFPMSALDRALGVPLGSTATFDRVVRSSTAVCPDLDISTCQVESFRRIGPAGNEASCTSNCTESDLVNVEAQACRNQDDFPTDIIANRDVEFVDLEERSCCIVGTSEPSSVCPRTGGIVGDPDNDFARSGNDSGSVGVGIIVAIVVVVVLVSAGAAAVCFYMRRKKSNNKPNHPNNNGNKPSRKTHTGSSSYPTSAIHEAQQPEPVTNLHVMPPPSNPHASTASAPSQDIHA